MAGISQELINILHGYEDGLSDSQLKPIFGDRYEKLAPAINELLGSNRIQLYQQHDGTLVYKALKAETAAKFEGLG